MMISNRCESNPIRFASISKIYIVHILDWRQTESEKHEIRWKRNKSKQKNTIHVSQQKLHYCYYFCTSQYSRA